MCFVMDSTLKSISTRINSDNKKQLRVRGTALRAIQIMTTIYEYLPVVQFFTLVSGGQVANILLILL